MEGFALEWTSILQKDSCASLDDEPVFGLGLTDIMNAIYGYLYATVLALAAKWQARLGLHMPKQFQAARQARTISSVQEPSAVSLEDTAPWLRQLTSEDGYKQVMDHEALKAEGGALPGDHLFRALAIGGMVQDSRVLIKQGQPSGDNPQDATLDVVSVWQLGNDVCGHAGIVHGGFTAAMIDESYGYLLYMAKAQGLMNFTAVLTASLEVAYKLPLTSNRPVCVTTWISSREGRKIWVEAAVSDRPLARPAASPASPPVAPAGVAVYATSKALFLIPRPEGTSTAVLQEAGKGRKDVLGATGPAM